MKRILFISPRDPDKPTNLKLLMGGENTYTRLVLSDPPKGIKLVHYEDALNKKYISYHWLQSVFVIFQKLRILPIGPRVQMIKLNRHFDAVYVHAYPVKIINSNQPLLLSESSSNILFLTDYLNMAKWKINIWQKIKKIMYSIFDIADIEVHAKKNNVHFVFSAWAKAIKKQQFGIENCNVIYPGLESPKAIKNKKNKNIKILFVGVWFERKGGRILLSVFRQLSRVYKNIQLSIVGELPKDIRIRKNERISQKNFVPYHELQELYKTHHILVHIPPKIEGFGMTVPEAMSYGMCPVVSNICVLPEFVKNNINGLVITPNSERALKNALASLIKNPQLRHTYGKKSYTLFKSKFSQKVFQKQFLHMLRLLFP